LIAGNVDDGRLERVDSDLYRCILNATPDVTLSDLSVVSLTQAIVNLLVLLPLGASTSHRTGSATIRWATRDCGKSYNQGEGNIRDDAIASHSKVRRVVPNHYLRLVTIKCSTS
jgi:hypothetical protein